MVWDEAGEIGRVLQGDCKEFKMEQEVIERC
jgi:hypothetical protein